MSRGYRKDGKKLGFQKGHKILLGSIPWNKGKIGVQKHSEETKRKISLANLKNRK